MKNQNYSITKMIIVAVLWFTKTSAENLYPVQVQPSFPKTSTSTTTAAVTTSASATTDPHSTMLLFPTSRNDNGSLRQRRRHLLEYKKVGDGKKTNAKDSKSHIGSKHTRYEQSAGKEQNLNDCFSKSSKTSGKGKGYYNKNAKSKKSKSKLNHVNPRLRYARNDPACIHDENNNDNNDKNSSDEPIVMEATVTTAPPSTTVPSSMPSDVPSLMPSSSDTSTIAPSSTPSSSLSSLPSLEPTGLYTTSFQIGLTTDSHGNEITIELINHSTGEVLLFENGFDSNTEYVFDLNLDRTDCFAFTIYDSAGNGICCQAGSGRYNLTMDGVSLKTSILFGFKDTTFFGERCPGDDISDDLRS